MKKFYRLLATLVGLLVVLAGLGVATPAQADGDIIWTKSAPVLPVDAPKGKDGKLKFSPPVRDQAKTQSRLSASAIDPGTVYRYYGNTYQFVPVGTKGVNAGFTIRNTYLHPNEYHTLHEIAVQSIDGRQTVEIGWGKGGWCADTTKPCLFAYHWVDKTATCYPNGVAGVCGWTPYASALKLRTTALADSPVGCSFRMGIRVNDTTGNWMLWATPCYGSQAVQWLGHFDKNLWANSDNPNWTIGLTQVFGEIAGDYNPPLNPSLDGYPCTDMGNGNLPTSTNGPYPSSGSRIGDIEFATLPKSVVNMIPEAAAPAEFKPDMAGAYDSKAIEGIADSGPGNRRYFNIGGPGFGAANGPTKPGVTGGC